jgi:hypothetical protein
VEVEVAGEGQLVGSDQVELQDVAFGAGNAEISSSAALPTPADTICRVAASNANVLDFTLWPPSLSVRSYLTHLKMKGSPSELSFQHQNELLKRSLQFLTGLMSGSSK